MKKSMHALYILLFASQIAAAQTAEKTLVSSFNPSQQTKIILNMDGEMEMEYWNGSVIKIQSTVSLKNAREAVLKSLVAAGRYRLLAEPKDGQFEISAPNLNKKIMLSGQPIDEQISYLIFVPEGMSVGTKNIEAFSFEIN